jgi:hypothetical protein
LNQTGVFGASLVSAVIEAMFYNKNSRIGVNVIVKYFVDNSGNFTSTVETQAFLPQNYLT